MNDDSWHQLLLLGTRAIQIECCLVWTTLGSFQYEKEVKGFISPNLGQRSLEFGICKDVKDYEGHCISWGETTSTSQRRVEFCQLQVQFILSHWQQMLWRFNLFNKWLQGMCSQQKASAGIENFLWEGKIQIQNRWQSWLGAKWNREKKRWRQSHKELSWWMKIRHREGAVTKDVGSELVRERWAESG